MKLLFLNKTKKHIAWFLCLVFIFGFFLVPSNVKAVGGVGDTVIDPTLIGFINAGLIDEAAYHKTSLWAKIGSWMSDKAFQIQQLIDNKAIFLKEYVLDPIAWTAANVIIDQFGDALVDWIRNGFEGSPMFLSDPEGFFRDTANDFSGAIIDALDMEWLCDPLGKLRLNIDFFFPGTDRAKYACTFNDIADTLESYMDRDDLSDWINVNVNVRERNIVRAYGSDYRNGGFLMWLFTAQKKNNDLGRTIQTASDAYIAASVSVGSEKFKLNMNQGFFGVRKCIEWQETYNIDNFAGASGSISENKCLKYQTQTPGQLVQDQLKDVAGKDLSRLQVADEIDEIIGALATTMMGWLLTGGNDGGGVLGYDKDSDYSGSNRKHYEKLSDNQKITTKKSDISGQIINIKSNEEQYNDSLEDYADALYGAKEKLEIVLAKLKCIRATSTNDTTNTYDESVDCDGADEDIKNISLSAIDKMESDISSDIEKTNDQISSIDNKISSFTGKYGDNATSTSAQVLELFDEFEDSVMNAGSLGKITSIISEYCYSYDKTNKTGEICGLFGEKSAGDSMAVYVSAESNPATQNSAGVIKTKIYWKALNAESCQATGGDSDKTWKKTVISTSGSYTTASFEDGEYRNYGVECSDGDNNNTSASTDISADSSVASKMAGSLFAKSAFVKSGESSLLYWLSSNASQCYLYSDQDSFSGDAEYVTSASTGLYENEGYYLKTSLTKTTGQTTATINSGETYKYKLVCGDSNDNYSILSETEISSKDGEKETYETHSEKEYEDLSEEAGKITTEMDSITLESACLINEYIQAEDMTKEKCNKFKLK